MPSIFGVCESAPQLFYRKEDRMIRIAVPPRPEELVAFAVSPLLECVLSLHVLLGPKHHALQHEWVRRMRALDPALRAEIDALGFTFRRHLPDLITPRPGGVSETFEQELAGLAALPPALLRSGFGRPLHDHGGAGDRAFASAGVREAMLEQAAAEAGEPARAATALLLDRPAEFAARFAALLERYWEEAFRAEWERIEPLLARSVEESGRLLAAAGIWPVLGRLPAHCRAEPALGELLIDLPHDHAVAVTAENPLVLCPSIFVWPHLRVSCDPPWPLALVYAAPALRREAEPRIPPAELLRILRALADDTRLRVLRLIAERPRTTQELEPLVGLSRAGLSKSLQRLADAGLVAPRRDGYYVVYRLVPDRLDVLGAALARFLEED
jgi:DNA-binding transcriptional ArsR family regulator